MDDMEWLEDTSEEEGIYSEEERESLMEDDEISAAEEAFMKGWEEAVEEQIVEEPVLEEQ